MSAVAKNGVELRIRARVTVRTNLAQLIGGATEETIIARVGEGIITSIGSSESHLEVMENPHRISKAVLDRGLDAHTAFEIVSIDIADIDVGENIGARLQADQAEADTRVARAKAEERRANAIAREQEMKAKVAENRSQVVLAEAEVPRAMADAFRSGHFNVGRFGRQRRKRSTPAVEVTNMTHSWSPVIACRTCRWRAPVGRAYPPREPSPELLGLLKTFRSEFVELTPGKDKFPADFQMGSAAGPPAERPPHRVAIAGPLAIARYEVPQNLWEAVMGSNPSRWKGPRNSVEMLSFDDAQDFCRRITERLRAAKLIDADQVVRLPSEAEWEYAARAGTTTRYSFGDDASQLDDYAWSTHNAAGNDPPVGAKPQRLGFVRRARLSLGVVRRRLARRLPGRPDRRLALDRGRRRHAPRAPRRKLERRRRPAHQHLPPPRPARPQRRRRRPALRTQRRKRRHVNGCHAILSLFALRALGGRSDFNPVSPVLSLRRYPAPTSPYFFLLKSATCFPTIRPSQIGPGGADAKDGSRPLVLKSASSRGERKRQAVFRVTKDERDSSQRGPACPACA